VPSHRLPLVPESLTMTQDQSKSEAKSTSSTQTSAPPSRRRLLLRSIAALTILGAVGWGGWYWTVGRWHVTTDDAYVGANLVPVTPQVAGTIVSIAADNGDLVEAGQVIVSIDPTDSEITVEAAEAGLASAVRKVRGLYNSADGARDALTGAEADVTAKSSAMEKVRADYERRRTLAQSGAISTEDFAHARDAMTAAESALTTARSTLAALRQQFQATNALVDETVLSSHPDVKAAAVRLRSALLEHARTTLKAPVSGYIAKRATQIGQRVQPSEPLMAIVPLQQAWVDANFSETQLANVRIGQPVEMRSDLYGRDVRYAGKVERIGVGTGSAFALLPAQNATGNWIKIVQRIPVRIAFTDPQQLKEHPVRVGMSMQIDVDVHDQDGAVLPAKPPTEPLFSSDLYRQQLAEADARIGKIIHANSAPQAAATVKP
jgi:membrane fusion protein, multidrug efflux system